MTQTQTLAGNILEYAIYQYADEKEKHMWILWQNAQKGWKLKSSQAEVDEIKHHCCHLQNYLSFTFTSLQTKCVRSPASRGDKEEILQHLP